MLKNVDSRSQNNPFSRKTGGWIQLERCHRQHDASSWPILQDFQSIGRITGYKLKLDLHLLFSLKKGSVSNKSMWNTMCEETLLLVYDP